MLLDTRQLEALEALLRTGSFEVAADELCVTVSALSQRIKQLEERIGAVLIIRSQPCRGTIEGMQVYRHAQTVALQEREMFSAMRHVGKDRQLTVSIALNADSLATWFLPALNGVDGLLFRLAIDDTAQGTGMLSRGDALAAVTIDAREVAGCDNHHLGSLRYVAVARPDFIVRWFADGLNAASLSEAPTLTYDDKDRLQLSWVEMTTGQKLVPPTHIMATADGLRLGALAGLGWVMLPTAMAASDLAQGRLKLLKPASSIDVPLNWQVNRSLRTALAPLTRAVQQGAAKHLLQLSENSSQGSQTALPNAQVDV